MELRLTIGDTVLTGSLVDNTTSHDFRALLPLTVTLRDYEETEKVCDLPRRLSTDDASTGLNPEVGDITYYAPWGNLAIFYRDFDYASGLVKLGHIDSGIRLFENATEEFTVTIDLVDEPTS
ncbi:MULTISPECIES: cyclophilin-like fold protein [Halobacteriales]|uniref:Cyclophilin-like fold protein n=1 Tax=Haloferax sp. Atlit-48N TaxID=2077198 RepID=A0ACD5I2C6_9EURY|nr:MULTISPECIES: cyclophilin-like fold protein [Halobacteria]RDZ30900.1 hypothetical protein DEQ67_11830 [Haloferax sp. Atlit-48N]RDZ38468.1 hypothetical protein C5B89_13880 [Haloferax sp. Atlit-47N]RLM31773.1 hypothetical protein DVK01_21350 [Haloarcula sp. Atlit-120R]